MEVQTKMQSVMAIMMGMQQVANTLHATSAFRIVTVRKVTDLWRAAQNRLTVSLGVSTVAAKAFMAAATMGASVIIGTVISAIDRFVSKKRDEKQAQEEAAKAQEDAMAPASAAACAAMSALRFASCSCSFVGASGAFSAGVGWLMAPQTGQVQGRK